MSLDQLTAKVGKFVTDNSPTILTAIGVVGSVGTAVLTAKASWKACLKLEDVRASRFKEGKDDLNNLDRFKLVWTLYLPSVTTAGLTVAAIIGANRIGLRRAATMAALYSASNKNMAEYKEKVAKHFGVEKEQKVRDELAQEEVRKNPPNQTIIIPSGQVMCYDRYSGRYFMNTMEGIKQAQNNVNHRALNYGHTTLTDLYDQLGMDRTAYSDDIGWQSDQLLDIQFSTVMSDNEQPCLAIEYWTEPVRDFERAH